MCGITGIFNLGASQEQAAQPIPQQVLGKMARKLEHRGPDEESVVVQGRVGLGFKRLSIIDLAHGQQPFYAKEGRVVMLCNGEIYNYKELRQELQQQGHQFKTHCDVEVIVHGYVAHGADFIKRLNGQFAFAIYDADEERLLMARDHFGVCPLFYTRTPQNQLVFGSEIKAILEHPDVEKAADMTGLDQILSFPGPVSPQTLFKNIFSLKPGWFLMAQHGDVTLKEYWDLDYPQEDQAPKRLSEDEYAERLEELLLQSIRYRLNADVPVGFYLSGGLDSSLVGAMMHHLEPQKRFKSFSIGFPGVANKEIDERRFQHMVARHVNSIHNEISFDWPEIEQRLRQAIYFSETALKETYNTCSLALSQSVRDNGMKVVLSGEGSDEFMGGYVGYRFDKQRQEADMGTQGLEGMLEDQVREELWGDPNFFYEKNQYEFAETKQALYSKAVNANYDQVDSIPKLGIDKSKLAGRSHFNKRSYLDLKLRLSDHLVSDHCDRVSYANSVEGRYPFLDVNLVEFLTTVPEDLKLNGLTEKYLLKKVARKYLPNEIIDRQKFGFVAPGSPQLLRANIDWVEDMLSYERIKRQGYFNPDTIERLKKTYRQENFKLNLPFDSDLLIVVLTYNIFLDTFNMPDYTGASVSVS